ncbi:hypothetical protein [Halomonas sp. SH5A2]|uniref:hypothetical protein n=1 Tax=Halomonas sp. SH5A2 TaxID=2749040 RepID=UPI00406BF7C4
MNAEVVARLHESLEPQTLRKAELDEGTKQELLVASMIAEMVVERLLQRQQDREKGNQA